jgi:hypothetical protein
VPLEYAAANFDSDWQARRPIESCVIGCMSLGRDLMRGST